MKRFAQPVFGLDETTRTNAKVRRWWTTSRPPRRRTPSGPISFLMGRKPRQAVPAPGCAVGRRGSRDPRLALRCVLRRRRRPGRNHHPAAADGSGRRQTDRCRRGSSRICCPLRELPEDRQREQVMSAWRAMDRCPALRLEQAHHRRLPRGGFAEARDARAGPFQRAPRGRPRPPPHGAWDPEPSFYRRLFSSETDDADISRPYPFFLAHPAGGRAGRSGDRRRSGRPSGSGTASAPRLSGGAGRPSSGRGARSSSPTSSRKSARLRERCRTARFWTARSWPGRTAGPSTSRRCSSASAASTSTPRSCRPCRCVLMAYDLLECRRRGHPRPGVGLAGGRAGGTHCAGGGPALDGLAEPACRRLGRAGKLQRTRPAPRGVEGLMLKRRSSPYRVGRRARRLVEVEGRPPERRRRADLRPARARQALRAFHRLHLFGLGRRPPGAVRQGLFRPDRRGDPGGGPLHPRATPSSASGRCAR